MGSRWALIIDDKSKVPGTVSCAKTSHAAGYYIPICRNGRERANARVATLMLLSYCEIVNDPRQSHQ
jgi:hypothetical protein